MGARGVSMSSLTWRDVVVKLLGNEAHLPLQRRVSYVGERIRCFFEQQKEAIVNFMVGLENSAASKMYSPTLSKHGKIIAENEMIRMLLFDCYDRACRRR